MVTAEEYQFEALRDIETAPRESDATVGLVRVGKEMKRAMILSMSSSSLSRKYLLVDEGKVEESPENLYATSTLGDLIFH